MSNIPPCYTETTIPLCDLSSGTFSIVTEAFPSTLEAAEKPAQFLHKQQSHLMGIFLQREDVFHPLLKKTHNGFQVCDDESWVFMDALKQFFQNRISLTAEITIAFPGILDNGNVSMSGVSGNDSIAGDALRYSKLCKDASFGAFIQSAEIVVFLM